MSFLWRSSFFVGIFLGCAGSLVEAQNPLPPQNVAVPSLEKSDIKVLSPFTGEVNGKQVRLRLQPNLCAHVVRELEKGDYVLVVGEEDDFYAIAPLKDLKAYVFRSYVLDGKIEGENVNIRLEPHLESPVVAQLSTGQSVFGSVLESNPKWLEIEMPQQAMLYVYKDYINNKGDQSLFATYEKQKGEAQQAVSAILARTNAEFEKPFDQIESKELFTDWDNLMIRYQQFPKIVAQLKQHLTNYQDAYIQKKVAFLEEKLKLSQEMTVLSQVATQEEIPEEEISFKQESDSLVTHKMLGWESVELKLFQSWSLGRQKKTVDDFYQEQLASKVVLKGIIEPYHKSVKNKPGDYVIKDENNLPVAFIYSTKVNLENQIGRCVTLTGIPRDNHNFAFPAYFVVSLE